MATSLAKVVRVSTSDPHHLHRTVRLLATLNLATTVYSFFVGNTHLAAAVMRGDACVAGSIISGPAGPQCLPLAARQRSAPSPADLLRLRGAGTHDGKRKKKRKVQARLAERDKQATLQSAAIMRAKRTKEKEAFRSRMERRRREREMMEAEDNESSEDDGAGLRYAMSLPKETRERLIERLRALEPPLPDTDNPAEKVPRLTDEELLAGIRPPPERTAVSFGEPAAGSGGEAQDAPPGGGPMVRRKSASRGGTAGVDDAADEGEDEDEDKDEDKDEAGDLRGREKEKMRRREELLEAEEKRFRVPDVRMEEAGGELDIDAILSVALPQLSFTLSPLPPALSPAPARLVLCLRCLSGDAKQETIGGKWACLA
jgi:hypothetical protein